MFMTRIQKRNSKFLCILLGLCSTPYLPNIRPSLPRPTMVLVETDVNLILAGSALTGRIDQWFFQIGRSITWISLAWKWRLDICHPRYEVEFGTWRMMTMMQSSLVKDKANETVRYLLWSRVSLSEAIRLLALPKAPLTFYVNHLYPWQGRSTMGCSLMTKFLNVTDWGRLWLLSHSSYRILHGYCELMLPFTSS